jgi:putative NADH-flavin reductase
MRIGIIGASGNIGSRVLAEAVARGHEVLAFTRDGAAQKGREWRDLDIFDLDALRSAVASVDVVVSSYHQATPRETPAMRCDRRSAIRRSTRVRPQAS